MEIDTGIIIVYCFLFVALVILVLILNPRTSSVTYVNQGSAVQPMVELCNPFLLQLHNQRETSSLRRVECHIQTSVDCLIQAFWGVNIVDLFSVLHRDHADLKNEMLDDSLLKDSSLSRSQLVLESRCDKNFAFEPEAKIDEAVLGSNLRQRYPLVIFIFLSDIVDVPSESAVVGLVSAIHVKDPLVKLDSHIIGQYLKLADNRLCSLSNLYASTDPSVSDEAGGTFCVVCQTEVASMATLPCRHLCTCQNCFSQLQRCPMCRSLIHSYFITKE